jgi:alginate O-acetyltransferase complex protein AlgI
VGILQKVVIADHLSLYINDVYAHPHSSVGIEIWLASAFFAFQLYCDFSAYSDIAIGAARTMGFRLMKNFDRPFTAKSFSEFWNRWHISLNTWFRDYFLFALPFGKSKKWMKFRVHLNLTITVMLIGLWHGANWTFVLWGGLMAFYMVFESVTRKQRTALVHLIRLDRTPVLLGYIQMLLVFSFMAISPILFRANSFSDIGTLVLNATQSGTFFSSFAILKNHVVVYNVALILLLLWIEFIQAKYNFVHWLDTKSVLLRWPVYLLFILCLLIFGVFNEQEFYYFQF